MKESIYDKNFSNFDDITILNLESVLKQYYYEENITNEQQEIEVVENETNQGINEIQ
jgi:hypothetical protein